MTPTLATPPSKNQKTGGYIYNARIAAILGRRGLLRHEFVRPEDIDTWILRRAESQRGADHPAPVILDSLYINCADRLAAVRVPTAEAGQRWILLAHLLPSQETNGPGERGCEATILPLFDAAITPSRHMRELLNSRGLPAEALAVCPPGTELPPKPAAPDPAQPLQVLTIASWIPRKNLEAVLDALEQCRELAWHWNIVGFADHNTEYVRQLLLRIANSPVGGRVTCHGVLDAPALQRLWSRTAVFALATRFESYGMVFAEALSYGIPVVAPRTGAVPEIVENGATGILYDLDCPALLPQAMRELLSDQRFRARLARAARAAACKLPTWEQTAAAFAAFCGAC